MLKEYETKYKKLKNELVFLSPDEEKLDTYFEHSFLRPVPMI